jgi:hypothetical protein
MVLENCFLVETASSLAEVDSAVSRRRFDLVILCHSLRSDEHDAITELVRYYWPNTKFLRLSALGDDPGGGSGPAMLEKLCATYGCEIASQEPDGNVVKLSTFTR